MNASGRNTRQGVVAFLWPARCRPEDCRRGAGWRRETRDDRTKRYRAIEHPGRDGRGFTCRFASRSVDGNAYRMAQRHRSQGGSDRSERGLTDPVLAFFRAARLGGFLFGEDRDEDDRHLEKSIEVASNRGGRHLRDGGKGPRGSQGGGPVTASERLESSLRTGPLASLLWKLEG